MVPTLKIPRGSLTEHGFINAYIKDATADVEYHNAIYILFKPKNLNKFRIFLDNERERTKAIIDDYDYKGGHVVLVYQLDAKFKDDFDLVRGGKYSKTSHDFQELFPKVVKIMQGKLHRDEISLQYRVFNKTQDLVDFWENKFSMQFSSDMEVWGGFFEEEEILNLDKIKEHV